MVLCSTTMVQLDGVHSTSNNVIRPLIPARPPKEPL